MISCCNSILGLHLRFWLKKRWCGCTTSAKPDDWSEEHIERTEEISKDQVRDDERFEPYVFLMLQVIFVSRALILAIDDESIGHP